VDVDPVPLQLRDERPVITGSRDLQCGIEQLIGAFEVEARRRGPVDRPLAGERVGAQAIVAALRCESLERLVRDDRVVVGAA